MGKKMVFARAVWYAFSQIAWSIGHKRQLMSCCWRCSHFPCDTLANREVTQIEIGIQSNCEFWLGKWTNMHVCVWIQIERHGFAWLYSIRFFFFVSRFLLCVSRSEWRNMIHWFNFKRRVSIFAIHIKYDRVYINHLDVCDHSVSLLAEWMTIAHILWLVYRPTYCLLKC